MFLHDLVGKRQTQPHAPVLGRKKRREDIVQMLLFDAGTGVAHFDDHEPVLLAVGLYAREQVRHPRDHRQLASRRHRLDGVLDKVQEHLDQLIVVAGDVGQARVVLA